MLLRLCKHCMWAVFISISSVKELLTLGANLTWLQFQMKTTEVYKDRVIFRNCFHRTALYGCKRGLGDHKVVCLSVTRVYCDQMNESSADILTQYEREIRLVFWHEEWLVGGRPLVPEISGQTDPSASKTAIFNRYSLIAPQSLHLAEQSSIMTNRKSTTSFPVSPRWTAYVRCP